MGTSDEHSATSSDVARAGTGVVLILTTVADDAAAARLSRALVEERLAACVTRMAAQSVYRWEGAVSEEAEVLLLIKTPAARRQALERRLAELHPYDCPEVVAIDPAAVDPRYRAWLLAACR